jgi:hypothetical protein
MQMEGSTDQKADGKKRAIVTETLNNVPCGILHRKLFDRAWFGKRIWVERRRKEARTKKQTEKGNQ